MIRSWFRKRWVSRKEHDAMIASYENRLVTMQNIVVSATEAVTRTLEDHRAALLESQALAERLGEGHVSRKLN
jgi:uncharacterized protein